MVIFNRANGRAMGRERTKAALMYFGSTSDEKCGHEKIWVYVPCMMGDEYVWEKDPTRPTYPPNKYVLPVVSSTTMFDRARYDGKPRVMTCCHDLVSGLQTNVSPKYVKLRAGHDQHLIGGRHAHQRT
jgi:hypothetical protein